MTIGEILRRTGSRPPPARAQIAAHTLALFALAASMPPMAVASPPFDAADPFATRNLVAPAPQESVHPGHPAPACEPAGPQTPLSLAGIVSQALCNNPQTHAAWANALAQASQVGVARSAYLPNVSASASVASTHGSAGLSGTSAHTVQNGTGSVSLGYVLYDFGARDAALDIALQTVASADYVQDATLQKVMLAAIQAYYQLFGTRDAVASTEEAERAAQRSLDAATARYRAGTATPSDRLLAQTAYSQAVLNRIQAQGAEKTAEGTLANVMGAPANQAFTYTAPQLSVPERNFEGDIGRLIATAIRQRPDLAAAQAQVEAAAAGVRAAKASGLPTVSLSANINYSDSSVTPSFNTQAAGILVSVPLFTGFNTTYRIHAAQAQLEGQQALRDNLKSQVALDVWQAYYNLETGTEAVRSTADLVASAQAAERVALGRYQAGAGTILDTLTAQAALANARLQHIQAQYSWYVQRATLAQALGQLDPATATAPNVTPDR